MTHPMRVPIKSNQVLIALVMLTAAFLRFYGFFDLPFMWDELSAWNRLHFETFSELIDKGIKPDGHPAGVQVFLYYWTSLFGDSEWIVKLPFNLMGLASVWLVYKIGKIWFSEETGIIAAAFTASLQFFVLYSPIARPYSSGLFLSLMMVLYWSLYFFKSPKRSYLAGFVIFAALSAYNHHFSLLFAAITGLSGLFIIPRKLLKEYIVSGFLIFILYTPHLSIFFHQLGVGGIGGDGLWLDKPQWSFIIDFFEWSFQFAIINYILVGIFLFLSLLYIFRHLNSKNLIKIILLILWFSLPLLIGLLYSIYINPVIQYSMLIFSFPYLLILISIFASELPKPILNVLLAFILSLNIYYLFAERQHYQIIQKQPFEVTAQLAKEAGASSFVVFNTIPKYQQYYFDKYRISDIPRLSIYDQSISLKQLDSVLKNRPEKNLVTCGLSPSQETILKNYFPYFVKRENAYTMDCYVFSKEKKESSQKFSRGVHSNDFQSFSDNWEVDPNRIFTDSLLNKSFEFDSTHKWGFKFKDSLIKYPPQSIIDFEIEITADHDSISPLWIFSAFVGQEQIFWRSNQSTIISKAPHQYNKWASLDTKWMETNRPMDSIILQCYFWNKRLENFKVSNIHISYRESNPIKYSLFDKIQ
jgi:hypothetical protein